MKINQLPEDMIGEIFSFISLETLSTCNKIFWRENYNFCKKNENSQKRRPVHIAGQELAYVLPRDFRI